MQRAIKLRTPAVYTAAIFLSAFLLFSVQPMFAKMVLPKLGGAPAVWAVSLCFFQVMLLAGYCYAHLIDRYLSARPAVLLHLALLLLALLALPIVPPVVGGSGASEGAYLWLMGILAAGVGLPFFALSGNAPLLQAWFSRSGQISSVDAYSLYAASNAGSLAALLAYPFLIEPLVSLNGQSQVWTGLYVVLGGLIAACGAIMLGAAVERAPAAGARAGSASWGDRLTWASLAFIPSGLLVAFTTYVTTDIAAVPLFWVVPLGLYLATFIVVFRPRLPVSRRLLLFLQPIALAVTIATMEWDASFAWALSCVAGIVAFVVTALICHRRLYERRPGTSHLTDFYLWMSIGGAAGGIFSALIAPQIFTSLHELPLFLGLGMLCRSGLKEHKPLEEGSLGSWPSVATATALVLPVMMLSARAPIEWTPQLRVYVLAALGAATILSWRSNVVQLGATAALVLGATLLPNGNTPVHVVRNFFGTHRVMEPPGGRFRVLLHGMTLHGVEFTEDLKRMPADGEKPRPLGYYHFSGPQAQGIHLARLAAGGPHQPLRVGMVGLGAGAMACHSLPGDRWSFYEIDPEVVKIATNPRLFSFIGACQPEARFVLGDARLTLAKEAPGSFDVLLIDAFSSDAIPLHLLTVEAMRLYAGLLSERGILIMHVSNQHLDLPPIVESNIAHVPGLVGVYAEGETGKGAIRSQAILIARNRNLIGPAQSWHNARALGTPTVAPWTDDYSDVLTPLFRRYQAKLSQAETK